MAIFEDLLKDLLYITHQLEKQLPKVIESTKNAQESQSVLEILTKTDENLKDSISRLKRRYPASITRVSYSSSASGSESMVSTTKTQSIAPQVPISKSNEASTSRIDGPLRPSGLRGIPTDSDSSKFLSSRQRIPSPSHQNTKVKRQWLEDGKHFNDSNGILIPTIDANTTESTLRSTFSHYGNIKDAKVLRNADGSPRGRAIVSFESKEVARQLVQKTVTLSNGSKVTVEPYQTKENKVRAEKDTKNSDKVVETLFETTTTRKVDSDSGRKGDSTDKCSVCRVRKPNAVLLWCGHGGVCQECGSKLKYCPKSGCGKEISKVTRSGPIVV